MSAARRHAALSLAVAALLPAATGQSFTDVTGAAGLEGVFQPSSVDSANVLMSAGVSVADVDGDGWEDIFWPAGSLQPARLFHNEQDGSFTDVAVTSGLDIAAAINHAAFVDVDDDGDLDAFLTVLNNQYLPGPLAADGSAGGSTSTTAGLGGLNGFGIVDYHNFLYLNDGTGVFTDATAGSGLAVAGRWGSGFGDLDGDLDLDVVSLTWQTNRPWFHVNNGQGVFRDRTPPHIAKDLVWGFTPRLVDYDFDGDIDVLATNDILSSRLWRNDGPWQFTDHTVAAGVGTDENGMGSSIADIDLDGDLDWFQSSIYSDVPIGLGGFGDSGNRMWSNDGDGTFTDVTDTAGVREGGWGWGAQFADLDHDGDPDLVHANGWYEFAGGAPTLKQFEDDKLRVFINDGTGVFTESASAVGIDDGDQGRGLVIFDYDHDGALDILVSNNDVGLRLYQGDPTGLGHWASIELRGKTSNHFGVGARVTVSAGSLPDQVAVMECANNFLSQPPIALWFGLGAETSASATVLWPSGQRSVHVLSVDARNVLDEPR